MSVSDFIYNFAEKVESLLTSDILKYFSVYSFIGLLAIGVIYSIFIFSFRKLREKNSFWCLYLFQTGFLFDVSVCFLEHNLFGNLFSSYASAYIFSFCKFALLLVGFALIEIQKTILLHIGKKRKAKRDLKRADAVLKVNIDSALDSAYRVNINNNLQKERGKGAYGEKSVSIDILDKIFAGKKRDICDINIAYVMGVLNALSEKNLTQSDRRFVDDLKFALKSPPYKNSDEAIKLNEDFRTLVKKMSEYNVVV